MKYIIPYNNEWPGRFELIVRFLRKYIPDAWIIHHVGSTSVPGMPSKDIIDIDIECPEGSINKAIRLLKSAGYDHEGDKGIPTREAFKPKENSEASTLPPHHLYECEITSPELFKHIAFREYLISHPERAEWLSERKIDADQLANSRSEYIENKSEVYEIITKESLEWAAKARHNSKTFNAG